MFNVCVTISPNKSKQGNFRISAYPTEPYSNDFSERLSLSSGKHLNPWSQPLNIQDVSGLPCKLQTQIFMKNPLSFHPNKQKRFFFRVQCLQAIEFNTKFFCSAVGRYPMQQHRKIIVYSVAKAMLQGVQLEAHTMIKLVELKNNQICI